MEKEEQERSLYQRFVAATDNPSFNLTALVWGLFLAMVWATVRNDVYLLAKAGEIIALALGKLLIQRQIRWFFRGLLATAPAIPVAVYTTTPIFWRKFLPVGSEEFFETLLLGCLCGLPVFCLAVWGLRRKSGPEQALNPDPAWFKRLNQIFKWALAGMVLSFHLANPPLIIAGILVFLVGIICLAKVRLNLTIKHVGNFLIIVGGATVIIALLLIPLGIAHVSGGEAAMAVIPGAILALLGFLLRTSRK
ncbi:MAG: hypothetical protein P1V20_13655 [Verrucomicrobiales bacterium]|nr:hypothetical protein [Verrucomicrobiales bacterium]